MSGAHQDASELLSTCVSVQEFAGNKISGGSLCQTDWRSKGLYELTLFELCSLLVYCV